MRHRRRLGAPDVSTGVCRYGPGPGRTRSLMGLWREMCIGNDVIRKEIQMWVTEGNIRGCQRYLSFEVTGWPVDNLNYKVALCTPQGVWVSRGIVPRILNPGIRWRLVVNFPLVYPRGRSGTHWVGGSMDPRALKKVHTSSLLPALNHALLLSLCWVPRVITGTSDVRWQGRWHMDGTGSAALGAEWVFLEVSNSSNCRHLCSSRSPVNFH